MPLLDNYKYKAQGEFFMSSFIYANLILSKDVEIAKEYHEPNTYLIKINDRWVCRIAETDYNGLSGEFSDTVFSMSEHIPVLFFSNSDNIGLGFSILQNRKIISSFYIDHEFDADLSLKIAYEMYGNEKGLDYWLEDMSKFIKLAAEQRDERLQKNFSNINVENFKLFCCTDEDIHELKNCLTPKNYDESCISMIKKFVKVMKLKEMEYKSWNYVCDSTS